MPTGHAADPARLWRLVAGADGPIMDLQAADVAKWSGEFVLAYAMGGPGYFHVVLTGADDDQYAPLADVYFGTGDNVWRKK